MEIINLSTEVLALLFLAAVIAGFIDALAGGGGLIALPALVLTGMPSIMALGTNKLQGCVGTATSSWVMFRKKMINWREAKWLMMAAFTGAAAGTVAVQFNDAGALLLSKCITYLITIDMRRGSPCGCPGNRKGYPYPPRGYI